jgi:hypothetical protein
MASKLINSFFIGISSGVWDLQSGTMTHAGLFGWDA